MEGARSANRKMPQSKRAASASAARRSAVTRPDNSPKRGSDDWRRGGSRTEKSERIRDALLHAAAEVVGEVGYADASIALITRKAGVALGTFYNYFESRQDILDALLPSIGAQMRAHVRQTARVGKDFREREELSFRSFFSFLDQTPHFFRILNEAESFAPKAHGAHIGAVARGYQRFLAHASQSGEIVGYSAQDLEVVVYILMAARSYLALRYARADGKPADVPERVVRAYMRFVLFGLQGVEPEARSAVRSTRAKTARKTPQRK